MGHISHCSALIVLFGKSMNIVAETEVPRYYL
jgi:hypothetical protein